MKARGSMEYTSKHVNSEASIQRYLEMYATAGNHLRFNQTGPVWIVARFSSEVTKGMEHEEQHYVFTDDYSSIGKKNQVYRSMLGRM